jgi:predicted TPR repeat methyltransferase
MNFDEAAPTWDGEERRVLRAKAVAERLEPILAPYRGKDALDFGCGTGLLSFFLRDFFARIDLLDPS